MHNTEQEEQEEEQQEQQEQQEEEEIVEEDEFVKQNVDMWQVHLYKALLWVVDGKKCFIYYHVGVVKVRLEINK